MKEEQTEEDPFDGKKQEIQALLNEKEIETEGLKIKQFPSSQIYFKLRKIITEI